mmetsp:Transcript_78256/g.254027  ORF Transcript_78256/g.254027 Transcript_78256/m.254027 type:complete len:184 (+) Transcript_78256:842-1393(+)
MLLFVGPEAVSGLLGGVGDGLELLSAFLFAVQIWRCEKIARNLPEDKIAELVCFQLGMVTVFSCIGLAAEGWSFGALCNLMSGWLAGQWEQVAVMGLVTTAFCLWAEARALRNVDAAPAALIYACEPLWGAGFAFLWHGEAPSGTLAICGGICLVLASGMGAFASQRSGTDDEGKLEAASMSP